LHQKTTLDNGLRLVTTTMPQTRSVSICIYIGVGSRYETDAEGGVSHFIEHLLFKGTDKRPTARDISGAIEGVGGIFNGGTDKEITLYWCKMPQTHFALALDVLADIVLHSKFDPAEIEKERHVIIEEINMSLDFPPQRVNMLIDELLWPNQPMGRDIAGTKESVSTITRDAMLAYMRNQYQPENVVVAVAGNIKHPQVIAAVESVFGDWHSQQPRRSYPPYQEQPAEPMLIETRQTEQVQLCLALPGLSLFDPKRYTLDLLNVILGEGMSSRLFTEIRDNLGLAYSIESHIDHHLDTGSMVVYAGVDPRNLEKAVGAIMAQLAQMRQGVSAAELTKARQLASGRMLLRMEDSRNVAGWLGGQEVLTGRIVTVDRIVAIINAITAAQLQELAEELIVDKRLRLALVGPVTKPERLEQLLKF